jgi:hypothetical protein
VGQGSPPRGGAFPIGGAGREARILRDRIAVYEDALDALAYDAPSAPFASARLLVQVYDGGAMPTEVPRVYFTHPVIATGPETEGAAATFTVDTATTVPVIVLWHVPSVGDYLTAYAVGGRWVSEKSVSSGGGPSTTCTPCNIPNEDLTISWVNLLDGDGSATMTYAGGGGGVWETGCADSGLRFRLICTGGNIELQALFFITLTCPTGETQYCSNLESSPLKLVLTSHTCSPFSFTFGVTDTDCPTLFGLGNTQFTITL